MRTATLVVLLTFLTLSITVAYAESEPVVEWKQMFGGSGHEVGFTACENSDGNYIMIGATESYNHVKCSKKCSDNYIMFRKSERSH